MSFWKDMGDFMDDAGSSTSDAFSTAWTFASDDGLKAVGHGLAATGRTAVHGAHTGWEDVTKVWDNPVVRPVLNTVNDVYHSTVDHPIATYGRVISDPNELGFYNFLLHPGRVSDAWHATGEQDLTAGQAVSGSFAGKLYAPDAEREAYFNTWQGRLSSGAADFAVAWYADPTVVLGKGAAAARTAKTTIKSNEERTAVMNYASGRSNAAQAGKRAQKLGDRMNAMIASTDGLTAGQLAQMPALKSSSDAGALAYLFERANLEHAGDEVARHAAKRDIFGAALGDPRAISRMRAQRQELADEMRRLAEPPTPTRFDERFTWDDHGQGAIDFFGTNPDPLDQRLIDQISGKLEKFDRTLDAAGTTSKITGTGLQNHAALNAIQQGYVYSGMGGRPTRVISGPAIATRLPGYVSLKDPVTGFDQFNSTLKAMVHTPSDVRQGLLDRYTRAANAGERRAVVSEAEGRIVNDTAAKYGLSPEAASELLKAGQGRRGAYLKALAGRLYSATDADKWISLVDPEADELLALSKPLARTQIEDLHPLMDPAVVDKFLRVRTNQRAVEVFAQRVGSNRLSRAATKAADATGQGAEWADDIMRSFTRLWKDSALFRLAFPARVQVDTQMRMLTHLGAMQYMSVMPSAVRGQAKYLLQGRDGQGKLRSLFAAPEDLTRAVSETLMRGGTYRGISIAPAQDIEQAKQIANRLFQNNGSMADLISELSSADLRNARGLDDWGIVDPTNEGWANSYVRAVNRQIHESPTIRKALTEPDDEALKRWITSDAHGQAEWREMKPGWRQLDPWIAKIREHVNHYLPEQELRDIVSARKLRDGDLEKFFGGKAAGNRMRIHGQAFAPTSSGLNRLNEKYHEIREGWYRWSSEAPETIMGRSPLYAEMFKTHMRDQIDRLGVDDFLDEEAIRRNADRMARRDVGRVLFDTSHVSNMASAFKYLSPFYAAWEDTMKKWGGLIYEDPSRAAHLVQVWHAPNNFGFIVDSEGNRVDANGHAFNAEGQRVDNQSNYRGKGQYVTITLPSVLAKHVGVGELRINKDSANVVFQGEPWWLPGFGPAVQVPANEIAKRAFPDAVDNPALHFILPYGITNDSPLRQLEPSWAKQAQNSFGNTQDYANTFSMLMAQEVVKYNLGERKALPTDDEVAGLTRNWFIMRAVTNFNSPVSVTPTPRFQMYIDRAHDYQRRYGKDWEQKFFHDFPEYFEMSISLSANETGINASEKAYDATKRYRSLIGAHPDYGWMFVGPANDPAQPFNSGVYTWQQGTSVSAASTQTYRSKRDPAEALKDVQASKGWVEYGQMKETVAGILEHRGLHSLSQKGATDIKKVWDAFVDDLGSRNASWADAYADRGPDKIQGLLNAATDGVKKDKSLAGRADFKALQEYVQVRAQVQRILQSRKIKSLGRDENSDVKQLWDAFTADLSLRSFGFKQMYDKVLEADDLTGEMNFG